MGRRFTRRVWHVIAALVPLPLIGAGYVAAVPGNPLAFRIELMLSGKGADYALTALAPEAAVVHQPLAHEAAVLFHSAGKGPRADEYLALRTTTDFGKHFAAADVAGAPDITGSLGAGISRSTKADRLNPPITEVALRGAVDDSASAALFMASPFDQAQLQNAFGGPQPPSPERIAYHPSAEALSFRSQGENQAEFEERERRCLATAIYFEARGEPVRGQVAVGQVIMNRVRSPQFPQTICGVVYQGQMEKGCQFSFACDGRSDKPKEDEQWALAQDIAKQITSGKVWLPEVGYSTYYHANSVRPGWVNNMSKIDSIGHHIFYKKRHEEPYVVEQDASDDQAPASTATASATDTSGSVTDTATAAASSIAAPITTALSMIPTGSATPPIQATSLGYAASE